MAHDRIQAEAAVPAERERALLICRRDIPGAPKVPRCPRMNPAYPREC